MSTIQHILVGTDFSFHSDAALQHAFEVAAKYDARVHVVHVFTLQDKPESASWSRSEIEDQISAAHHDLEAAVQAYRDTQRLGHVLWHEGDPAPGILRAAEEQAIDLVIVGASGRAGVKRLLLGSVAEEVVRKAKCSVWVVRN